MSYLDPIRDFVKTLEADEDFAEQIHDMVIEFHIRGKFSEGYAAAVLGIDRMQVRELKNDQFLPCGHHVKNLGGFGGCNPKGSCMVCEAGREDVYF